MSEPSNLDSLKEIHLRQDSFEQRLFMIEQNYKELNRQNEEILKLLKPISETYTAVTTLRKWANALAIAVVTFTGAFFALKEVFKSIHK